MAPAAIATQIINHESFSLSPESVIKRVGQYGSNNNKNSHYAKNLVMDALEARISQIDTDRCEPGEEDAFFVADMGEVYRQHVRWKTNLPRVKPHYAVKCNPDPQVIRLLAALGCGFDCASKTEIDQVLQLGVDPNRIIFAQPCKTRSVVRYANKQDVRQMTFDNADELYKIKDLFPEAELYLRILTDDSSSLCRLSLKFGASLDCAAELLDLAKQLSLNVVGVSFHVGSGASDPECFRRAVQDARVVFDQATECGFHMHTLDVGGGFSGDGFEAMASVLSDALDEHFPPNIRIISEPGRYFVAEAYTLACNVIARRDVTDPLTGKLSYMLYLNDGVYGNFSNIIFDHQIPVPKILSTINPPLGHAKEVEYSLWGPTCDGIDRITDVSVFRHVIDIGDWLYFEDMGAYTRCSATRFNGFTDTHDVIYISSEIGAKIILGL